jgi:glycine cleavage system aminomethyltransferase T
LTGLLFNSAEVPKPGAAVLASDATEAGHVTSAAFSPLAGKAIGMAYLRREYLQPGTTLQCGDSVAEVIEMPLRAALASETY